MELTIRETLLVETNVFSRSPPPSHIILHSPPSAFHAQRQEIKIIYFQVQEK